MSDETDPRIVADQANNEEENDSAVLAKQKQGTNDYFRQMIDRNFLDYASYVIGSRAIPDVDDGLKPVQRRILWALYQVYDGRTQKVANIVGNTMHYHPHGDASIGDALVVLANKGGVIENTYRDRKSGQEKTEFLNIPYFIMKQGNFGNILTGSPAAAGRYTECGLTKLAYETMFNNDITPFVPNYDGRKEEPVVLPAKLPSLLMLGSDGIAVGMSTCVLPHNFNELIDAEIAVLQGRSFQLYPDFQQGALMDVREYDDGTAESSSGQKSISRAETLSSGRSRQHAPPNLWSLPSKKPPKKIRSAFPAWMISPPIMLRSKSPRPEVTPRNRLCRGCICTRIVPFPSPPVSWSSATASRCR